MSLILRYLSGSSTVYRGVFISGGWNREVLLHTEVFSFQGVGLEGFYSMH